MGAAFAVLLGIGLAVPAAASAAPTAPASAGSSLGQAAQLQAAQLQTMQLDTLQQQAGLSATSARQRLTQEHAATGLVSGLRGALGSSYAGSWFAPGSTVLTVATTDRALIQRITAAGAQPMLVSRDSSTLDQIMGALDSRSRTVPDNVTGWYVDPATNSVVVSALDPAAARSFAAGLDGVRVEQVKQRPVPYIDLVGGGALVAASGARCSIGFNATSGNARYVITAGHCTNLGGAWTAEDGSPIGSVARSSFPGNDFGIIAVTSPSAVQTSSVATSNGFATVNGIAPAPIGASVCRSGSSSGYHCGTVEAVNQTVNYGDGDVVDGLTRTSVCAEPGDSGGPYMAGDQAQGVLSGGFGGCLLGGETYFQPVGEVLSAYGLRLVTGATSRSTAAQPPRQMGSGLLGMLGLG